MSWRRSVTKFGTSLIGSASVYYGPFFALVAGCAPLAVIVAGCASNSYAGVDFRPSAATEELQALAQRAKMGDKYAQFKLGERYENGNGVARDLGRATALYSAAARDEGGPKWVYAPSPGNGAPAQMLAISRPRVPGLPEAKERLEALKKNFP